MGASESRELRERLRPTTRSHIKKLSTISWDEFAACVRNVNSKCRDLRNDNGEYFCFGAKNGTGPTERWKEQLEITCVAVNPQTDSFRLVRVYTLQGFLNIYHSFTIVPQDRKRKEGHTVDETPVMTESIIESSSSSDTATTSSSDSSSVSIPDENYCCVCFDRVTDTILPCLHSFCAVCITAWTEYAVLFHCPLCKTACKHPIQDSWEMATEPNEEEVLSYFSSLIKEA